MKRLVAQLSLAMTALVLLGVGVTTFINITVLRLRLDVFFPPEFWQQIDELNAAYLLMSEDELSRVVAGLLADQLVSFQEEGTNILPILDALGGYDFTIPLASAFLTALIGLLLAFMLSKQIARPVSQVAGAARELARGELGTRATIGVRWTSAEVTGLAQDFNRMAGLLERSEEERKALIADVAHELRTPLTVLQGHLDAMIDGYLEPNEANLSLLAERTEMLSHLVQDLRTLSLSDAGRLTLDLSELDLVRLADNAVRSWQPKAEAEVVILTFASELERAPFTGDAQRLAQVLDNLLSNALRFTPGGGEVRVGLERDGSAYTLSVSDTGSGIPPGDLPHIFERFYRAEVEERSGSGLGLTIAQSLIELHSGHLTAHHHAESGAVFELALPVRRRDA